MDPLTIEATPAAAVEPVEPLTPEELLEAARPDHAEVVEELERLQDWLRVLVGKDIWAWGGKKVN